MYYVYILESIDSNKTWYTGYTSDLKERLRQHNTNSGCKTTKNKKWKLIYYEAYIEKLDAIGREKFLKSGSGKKYIEKQLNNYLTLNIP